MEAKYICVKECYAGRLCRIGDIVGAEVQTLAPSCFTKAKRPSAIQEEAKAIINGDDEEPVQMSNYEMLMSRKANVNGMKKEK